MITKTLDVSITGGTPETSTDDTLELEYEGFFKLAGIIEADIDDLAINHDKYIYGK
ncbi:MAG: hypothetical protein HQL61_02980 [Magnetococcales bacterium]|nr:hypothetical protein [Nitrospirota bacterium]